MNYEYGNARVRAQGLISINYSKIVLVKLDERMNARIEFVFNLHDRNNLKN